MTDVKTWAERIRETAQIILNTSQDVDAKTRADRIRKMANEIIEISQHAPDTHPLDQEMFLAEHDENVRLHTQVEELVDLLDQINGAFYARTSKKAWLALMEKTKPLIRKVRAEKESKV